MNTSFFLLETIFERKYEYVVYYLKSMDVFANVIITYILFFFIAETERRLTEARRRLVFCFVFFYSQISSVLVLSLSFF